MPRIKTMPRIVISKRWTGLGDCITSLLGAWRFAKKTNRLLVADWRFSRYSPDRTSNVFGLIFDSPTTLSGVRFLDAHSVNQLNPTGTFWKPEIWNRDSIHQAPVAGERGNCHEVLALLKEGKDVPEDIVVFDHCLSGGFASPEEGKEFIRGLSLILKPFILESVQAFASRYFSDAAVVGLHVRHGNGGSIGNHAEYWAFPKVALRNIKNAVKQAEIALKSVTEKPITIFLATDSAYVQDSILKTFPKVLTHSKEFRKKNEGELHLGPNSYQGLNSAMIDMALLSYSNILIRYPESSFSFWPNILKPPLPSQVSTLLKPSRLWRFLDFWPYHASLS